MYEGLVSREKTVMVVHGGCGTGKTSSVRIMAEQAARYFQQEGLPKFHDFHVNAAQLANRGLVFNILARALTGRVM